MQIDNVKLIYPYVKYRIKATYYTPRIPTAIEWLVLEAVKVAEEHPSYADLSVEALFQNVFFMSDSDKLIKPVLISLADLGVIQVAHLHDNAKLKNLYMRDMHLTEKGKGLRVKGTLPSSILDDTFEVYYDIYNNKLVPAENRLIKGSGAGITIIDMPSIVVRAEIFPNGLATEYLEKMKGLAVPKRLSWLEPTTSIENLEPLAQVEYCQSAQKEVDIIKDGILQIDGVEDIEILQAVSQQLEDKYYDDSFCRLEPTDVHDWDDKFEDIFFGDGFKDMISEQVKIQDSVILSDQLKGCRCNPKSMKAKNLHVCVLEEQDSLKVDYRDNIFWIDIPDKVLLDGDLYLDKYKNICRGNFNIYAGNQKNTISLYYYSNKKLEKMEDKIFDIAIKYFHDDMTLLLLLWHYKNYDEYNNCVRELLEEDTTLTGRIKIVESLNKLTQQAFSKKAVHMDILREYFVEKLLSKQDAYSLADTLEILNEINSIEFYAKNEALYRFILQGLLEMIVDDTSYKNLARLWTTLKNFDSQHYKYVCNNGLYKHLYGSKAKNALVMDFKNEDYITNLHNDISIEAVFIRLRNATDTLNRLLPKLMSYGELSDEICLMILGKNFVNIEMVANNLNIWRDTIHTLNEYDINLVDDYPETYLGKYNAICSVLMNNIDYFFDRRAIKYNKVYVADSSALMNNPEIVETFDKSGNMLIIPIVVTKEIDGNKQDEIKGIKARNVARAIELYRNREWLNVGEESDLMLIPDELRDVKDGLIISVAIKYYFKKPIFICDDINACTWANGLKVDTISSDHYLLQVDSTKKKNVGKGKKNINHQHIKAESGTIDRNKKMSCKDLASELGISVFDLTQSLKNANKTVSGKTVFSPKEANKIRKEFAKK